MRKKAKSSQKPPQQKPKALLVCSNHARLEQMGNLAKHFNLETVSQTNLDEALETLRKTPVDAIMMNWSHTDNDEKLDEFFQALVEIPWLSGQQYPLTVLLVGAPQLPKSYWPIINLISSRFNPDSMVDFLKLFNTLIKLSPLMKNENNPMRGL